MTKEEALKLLTNVCAMRIEAQRLEHQMMLEALRVAGSTETKVEPAVEAEN